MLRWSSIDRISNTLLDKPPSALARPRPSIAPSAPKGCLNPPLNIPSAKTAALLPSPSKSYNIPLANPRRRAQNLPLPHLYPPVTVFGEATFGRITCLLEHTARGNCRGEGCPRPRRAKTEGAEGAAEGRITGMGGAESRSCGVAGERVGGKGESQCWESGPEVCEEGRRCSYGQWWPVERKGYSSYENTD